MPPIIKAAGHTFGHKRTARYRARVEDREGDRWSVTGTLEFLHKHCQEQHLRIVWIRGE